MKNITANLLYLLSKGIITFTYRKVDGSIREAVGTRNLGLLSHSLGISVPTPKTGRNNPTAYYDIEKGAWRSFVADNVLAINGIEIDHIKGIKSNRIVKVGSAEDVDIPMGFGGDIKEKIHDEFEKIGEDIKLVPLAKGEPKDFDLNKAGKMLGVSLPSRSEKVGDAMLVEDFAKLVAKYVVAEIVDRLTR